jgi:hypothetical protein
VPKQFMVTGEAVAPLAQSNTPNTIQITRTNDILFNMLSTSSTTYQVITALRREAVQ